MCRNKIAALIGAFLLGNITPAFAVVWCDQTTIVRLPPNNQFVSWNGQQLQNYISAHNITCPDINPDKPQYCLARTAIDHYCDNTYGFPTPTGEINTQIGTTLRTWNEYYGDDQYSYHLGMGATFRCKVCAGPYPVRITVGPVIDIGDVATPVVIPNGMTWQKKATEPVSGAVTVGCKGGLPDCDPRQGDTQCSTSLPLLCINKLGASLPNWVDNSDPYTKWSGGVIATTPPISPAANNLSTLTAANQHCEASFGSGWQVAGFHDGTGGRGWGFKAYGNVGTQSQRFWVNIRDQVNGNCWTQ